MNVDERDTRLGDVLDRAVRGIETAGEPSAVERRGSRRQAGVLIASVTAVGVFLAAVAFAATQVGRDAKDAAGSATTFASPNFRWTMPIPAGWRSGAARAVGGPAEMLSDLRTSFVTTSLTATFTGPVMVGSPLPAGIDSQDVIVIVDPFVGTGESQPTTFVPNAERDDIENPGWAWRDGKICGETGCARIYIWHGPEANETDLATALSAAEGVRMVRSPPDASVLAPAIDYRDGVDGFSMSYPAGWTVADENLTPLLASPHEILSVGTYPLRPGGKAPIDAYLPKNALADLGADDVFVTVQESDAEPGSNSTRPSVFTPASVCDDGDPACRDGTALGLEGVRAWWIPFTDPSSARAFYAFVAMGEDAYQDPARSTAAWAVLDSLSFEPFEPPISFSPAAGWISETFVRRGSDPAMVWESNQPFSPGDARPSIPGESILALGPDGVLVVAWEVLRAPPDPANPNFPIVDLPLKLTEPEISYEGRLDPSISRSAIWAQVSGRYLQVWVFFGSPAPSDAARAEAQSALDRLIVVPR